MVSTIFHKTICLPHSLLCPISQHGGELKHPSGWASGAQHKPGSPISPGRCQSRVFKLRLMMCPEVLHFSAVKLPSEGKAVLIICLELLLEAGGGHARSLSLPSVMDGWSSQDFSQLALKYCLSSAHNWAQYNSFVCFNPLFRGFSLPIPNFLMMSSKDQMKAWM